jgi:hypothetical protein
MLVESRETQAEPPAVATPKPASRVPTKPPTRVASPSPQAAEVPAPSAETEPPVVEGAPLAPLGEVETPAPAPEQPPEPPAAESVPAEPAAVEEDGFVWGQSKSKAASRKASKAGSKAGSKVASKVPSKVASPKGTQTPNPENASAGAPREVSAADGRIPSSGVPSPLPTVHEGTATETPAHEPAAEVVPEESSQPPGSFIVVNAEEAPVASAPAEQNEPVSTSFGESLAGSVGGMFGVASSAFSWGSGKKEEKGKSPTPKALTPAPAWGTFGSVAPSIAGSTSGIGWGPATGNDNSAWLPGLGNKVANASAADLLSGDGTVDPPMGGEESHVPNTADEGPPAAESQEQAGPLTKEQLRVQTDVPSASDAVATEPAATGDLLEGEEGGEKPEEDEWFLPVKQKKKKGTGTGANTGANTGTPVTPNSAGGADEGLGNAGKKKGKGKKK